MKNAIKYIANTKNALFTLLITAAIVLSANNSSMLTGHPIQFDLDTDNYVGTHNFQVIIPGIDVTNTEFVFVGGLESKSIVVEGKKGEQTIENVYAPVELQRIYKGVDDFYRWRLDIESGIIEKRDVQVMMLNAAFQPVRAVLLEGAWPSSWQMPNMDASASGAAMETMFLTADQITEIEP